MRLDSVHSPVGMLWGIIVEYGNTPNYTLYLPTGLWTES